jgi:hypothetical protein
VFGVHFGTLHGVDDHDGRTRGAICPSTDSPYPVVVSSRDQYERAPAMAYDLDRPAASLLQKRIELASEPKIRRRGHAVVQYFDRSHGIPNVGDVAASRQLLKPIFAEAGSIRIMLDLECQLWGAVSTGRRNTLS